MSVAREIRITWPSLRRDTTLTTVVVLMLPMAIAATTTIFSIVHGVLLRPLPFADPDRVVLAWTRNDVRNAPVIEVSLGELNEWRARASSLASLDVFGSVNWSYRISAPGEPFTTAFSSVSASFFDTLGAQPMLGRTFRPEDDRAGAPATVVVSARLWRRHFSSDPSIVGKSITIGEGSKAGPAEVIGVMSPEFDFPAGAELWSPTVRGLAQYTNNDKPAMDGLRPFYAVGRLREGVTPEQAHTELLQIARTWETYIPLGQEVSVVKHYVVRTQGDPLSVVPAVREAVKRVGPTLAIDNVTTMEQIVGKTIAPWRFSTVVFAVFSVLALIFATIGLAALIAYAVKQRTREIGIRVALGARPRDVVQLLVREAAALVLAGLAIGIPAALVLTRVLAAQLFSVSPPDPPTFVVIAAAFAMVSLAAAYLPARAAAAVDPVGSLRRE